MMSLVAEAHDESAIESPVSEAVLLPPAEDSGAHSVPAPPSVAVHTTSDPTTTSRSLQVAQTINDRVRTGLDDARRSLKRRRAEWDKVVAGASLSAIKANDPIADLAARLDREASFWRSLALSHVKPAAPRYLAMSAAGLGLVGGAVLTALASLRGLFSSSPLPGAEWAAIVALAVGVALTLAAATWLQRSTNRASAEALSRGDAAERRLHEVAALLALRHADEKAYRDALMRYLRPDDRL